MANLLFQFKVDKPYEQINKREWTNKLLGVVSLQQLSISLTSSNVICFANVARLQIYFQSN